MKKRRKINWNSIPVRIAAGLFIAILLTIPMAQVKDLIRERKNLHRQVSYEINKTWGGVQNLQGPFLVVPISYPSADAQAGKNNESTYEKHAVFIPNNLKIETKLVPEYKSRGIYKYIVYQSEVQVSGHYSRPDLRQLVSSGFDEQRAVFDWENAKLKFYISDLKGLTNEVKLNWNDATYPVQASVLSQKVNDNQTVRKEGFASVISFDPEGDNRFRFNLRLKGSKAIEYVPMAMFTEVKTQSSWHSPKYYGSYLPDDKNSDEDGFAASWNISSLNRPIKQAWLGASIPTLDKYKFGVELIEPVDKYLKSMRAAKYAILFILLTFVGLFFVEIILKSDNNPLQYLLIGVALVLFYSLLLSLTEHLSFDLAYLISAAAIIGLISLYTYSTTKNVKASAILFLLWSALYGYLFFILQLEDFALLAGNIGLFVILALIMFSSRKLKLKNDAPDSNEQDKKPLIDNGDLL
jgi:inner membrane protein